LLLLCRHLSIGQNPLDSLGEKRHRWKIGATILVEPLPKRSDLLVSEMPILGDRLTQGDQFRACSRLPLHPGDGRPTRAIGLVRFSHRDS